MPASVAENPIVPKSNGGRGGGGVTSTFVLSYIVLVVLLTVSLLAAVAGVDVLGASSSCLSWEEKDNWNSSNSSNDPSCQITTISAIQYATITLYLVYLMYGVACDRTCFYLSHTVSRATALERLTTYRTTTTPEIAVWVRCWHYSYGGAAHKRRPVTTHVEKVLVPLFTCVDTSPSTTMQEEVSNQLQACSRMTKVQITQSFTLDQGYKDFKEQVLQMHKHRDEQCTVTDHTTLPDFMGEMLVVGDDDTTTATGCCCCCQKKTLLLNTCFYTLAFLLVFPALPYRLWLASATNKIKIPIRKEIHTASSSV